MIYLLICFFNNTLNAVKGNHRIFNSKSHLQVHQLLLSHAIDQANKHTEDAYLHDSTKARDQKRTGPPGCMALARRAGWSGVQVGRHIKC